MVRTKLFSCGVALALALSMGRASDSVAGTAVKVNDPNAVLQTVLSAIKNLELPVSGRGRAAMTLRSGRTQYVDTEVVADFVFKDASSRTDVLSPDASGALSRFYCNVLSDKASIAAVSYRYSTSAALNEEAPEKPRQDAEFANNTTQDQGVPPNSAVDGDQEARPLDTNGPAAESGEPDASGRSRANRSWILWTGAGGLLVTAGPLALLLRR